MRILPMANRTGSKMFALVYDPPSNDFPHLAALFLNGRLLHAEPCSSIEEGEARLEAIMEDIAGAVRDDGGGQTS